MSKQTPPDLSGKPRHRGLPFALLLALALSAVALIGVGLTVLVVQRGVTTALAQFQVRRQQDMLIQWLAQAYARYGSWDQMAEVLQQEHRLPHNIRNILQHRRWLLTDAQGRVVAGTLKQPPRNWERERVPIEVGGEVVGWLWVAPDARTRFATAAEALFERQTRQAAWVAAVVGLLVAIPLALVLAYSLARPLKQLLQGLDRIAQGELGIQVPVPKWQREWAHLTESFNAMSRALARAEHLRKQMTADLAHDLRTPITVLMGYLEGLQEGWIEPSPEVLKTLYQETEYLQRMVTDLRLLSLQDAGKLTLNKEMVPPASLVDEVVRRFQPQAEEKGIRLEAQVQAGLPPWPLDPNAMRRVLDNLVKNALKYTPEGGRITVRAWQEGDRVCFAVEDTGRGIPAEHLPYIFERFYRVDQARSEAGEGEAERSSGLGLAIVKALVEAHGGAVTVESRVGQGTRFRLCLPGEKSAVRGEQ